MSSSSNKYSKLFNERMSSTEARYVLYSNCDGLSDQDRNELLKAYEPVCKAILHREIEASVDYLT